MAVKIRLAQRGKKKTRTYRVVVADARSPRDGKYIEDLGFYNPHDNPSTVDIDVEKAISWLDKGAQPSERAQKILEISGAWSQWRATKGEEVAVPEPPEQKIKSSSKAHNKQEEETAEEVSEETAEEVSEETAEEVSEETAEEVSEETAEEVSEEE
jgi:small subunit ribosomal protein S16